MRVYYISAPVGETLHVTARPHANAIYCIPAAAERSIGQGIGNTCRTSYGSFLSHFTYHPNPYNAPVSPPSSATHQSIYLKSTLHLHKPPGDARSHSMPLTNTVLAKRLEATLSLGATCRAVYERHNRTKTTRVLSNAQPRHCCTHRSMATQFKRTRSR